jgi:hypothetical protein
MMLLPHLYKGARNLKAREEIEVDFPEKAARRAL